MIKCPICRGTGKIQNPKSDIALKKSATFILHEQGYGVRQIQRLLGYKSPRSVSMILKIKEGMINV